MRTELMKTLLIILCAISVITISAWFLVTMEKSRDHGGIIPQSELEAKTKSADDLQQQWQEAEAAKRSPTAFSAVFQGTSETNYAKDWVVVNDIKLSGITSVKSAPGAHARLT